MFVLKSIYTRILDTGPFIQELSKHFNLFTAPHLKVMFLNAQSVRNKALDSCENVDLVFLCEM